MNCKKNASNNPGEERQLFHPESEKVVEIGLERLRSFKNHPFKVKEDEAMAQLMESIERYGIMNPLIVMPTREGVYQIVSGHRRKYCAEKLGYTQVPVIIRYMKEEDSIISMVDSNLHRDKILFSEKAFAYYMKNEAMKRKTGKRRRTQEGQLESIKGTKTIHLIGKETGETQCRIRMTPSYIHKKILEFVPVILPDGKPAELLVKTDVFRRKKRPDPPADPVFRTKRNTVIKFRRIQGRKNIIDRCKPRRDVRNAQGDRIMGKQIKIRRSLLKIQENVAGIIHKFQGDFRYMRPVVFINDRQPDPSD